LKLNLDMDMGLALVSQYSASVLRTCRSTLSLLFTEAPLLYDVRHD
jgi:hypothetical protein